MINCLSATVTESAVLDAVRQNPLRWHEDENLGWEYIAGDYVLGAVWPMGGAGGWTWRTMWCGAHDTADTAQEGKENVLRVLKERIRI